jgi:hypothetical protein
MNPVRSPNKADLPQTKVSARRNAKERLIFCNPEPDMAKLARFHFRGRRIQPSSDPIAALPNEQDIGGDQADHDKHPVLDLEAQNGEMLDQKLHRPAPFLGRISGLATEIYYFCTSEGVRAPRCFKSRPGSTVRNEIPNRPLWIIR